MRSSRLLALALAGCSARGPAGVGDVPQVARVGIAPVRPEKHSRPTKPSDDEAPPILPCDEGPELDEALAELRSVDAAIDQLRVGGDPKPMARTVESLYRRRCFDVGVVGLDAERVDSALSLREFWKNARTELLERLSWGKSGQHYLWTMPTLRHALAIDVTPRHPLRPILCPSEPKTCGEETAGWTIRAESALALRGELRHRQQPRESCENRTSFVEFTECTRRAALTREALPLGRFRAPTDGWLLLRGPPKLMNCPSALGSAVEGSQLRVYDLSTGSAWIAESCGGNAIARSGTLPVDELREAAWMTFLSSTVDELMEGKREEIPSGIAITSSSRGDCHLGGRRHRQQSSRRLVWQWVRGNSTVASGILDRVLDSEEHAAELLRIAEAGFVKGTARVPPALPWKELTLTTLRVGAEQDLPDERADLYDELERVLSRAITTARAAASSSKR